MSKFPCLPEWNICYLTKNQHNYRGSRGQNWAESLKAEFHTIYCYVYNVSIIFSYSGFKNRIARVFIRFNCHVNALELKLVWHPQNSLDTHTGPKTPWAVDSFSMKNINCSKGTQQAKSSMINCQQCHHSVDSDCSCSSQFLLHVL